MSKLLVTGANGFIGSEVCKVALGRGFAVVCVARSGAPDSGEPWTEAVTWAQANVLEPNLWRAHLADCDAVVHSIGILQEKPDKGVTFGRINGDTAIVAAEEAEGAGVSAFVFMSASTTPPTVDKAYLEHKRRAERAISEKNLRSVFLRPALIYGSKRPLSQVVSRAVQLAQRIPGVPHDDRPLPVEVVARAAVNAAQRTEVSGVLDVDAIEALGKV